MKFATMAVAALAAASFGAASASAVTLYSNGPSASDFSAWALGFGYSVSDSFNISGASIADGFTFTTWSSPNPAPTLVDWSISSVPFGAALASGTGTAIVSSTYLTTALSGFFAVYDNAVSIAPLALGSGTYWLNLSNATDGVGNISYWEINNGPSNAWHNTIGDLTNGGCEAQFGVPCSGSSSFTISGTSGAVPEPASWALMIAGFGLTGAALRRRRVAATA